MNILDENILDSQRRPLRKWGISYRQIGVEIGRNWMSRNPKQHTLFAACFVTLTLTPMLNAWVLSFALHKQVLSVWRRNVEHEMYYERKD